MENILVTLTTVTYNSAKTLDTTIKSVLNQTYSNIEYIIKDGLSSDATLSIAESYRDAFEKKGIKYTIISSKDNGMYDALNVANEMANGVLIGNVNSDDYLQEDAVSKVVGLYETEHFDLMYARINMIYPNGKIKVRKARYRKLCVSRDWNHPSQFATRELYMKEKYSTADYCKIHADFDLLLRVRRADYKIVVSDDIISNFRMDGMSHERSIKACSNRAKDRFKIYRSNGYSWLYLFECIMVESAKYILG